MCLISSQVPVSASNTRDQELPNTGSVSAKANVGLLLREVGVDHANQGTIQAPASEGNVCLGDPEEDENPSHHSHSTASSQCSATYSNLGKKDTSLPGL